MKGAERLAGRLGSRMLEILAVADGLGLRYWLRCAIDELGGDYAVDFGVEVWWCPWKVLINLIFLLR